jgi:hypothetical protein
MDGPIRPFVDAGPVLRHISGIEDVLKYTITTFPPTSGAISSSGVALKLLNFRISPEIRYTRWTDNSFAGSTDNQADLMVGFTF